MTVPITLRRMSADDLDAIQAIEKDSFPTPWSRSAFESHLEHPEFAYYLVALSGEEVAGYTGLFFGGGYGQVTNLAVRFDQRHRGIGTRLLLAILQYSIDIGVVAVSLEVRVGNINAQRLYEKFGFSNVGVRKNYYVEIGEDAYVMCLFNVGSREVRNRLQGISRELERGID